MLDVIVKLLESLCMFLVISVCTWRLTRIELVRSPFFRLNMMLSIALFLSLNVSIQIVFEILLPIPQNKAMAIIASIGAMSMLFSVFYCSIRKVHKYLLPVLLSFALMLSADIATIGVAALFKVSIDSMFDNPKIYAVLCVVAMAIKYLFLGIVIAITEPTFFKKLLKWQKDNSVTLLSSTVTAIASTQARFPSWLFFYQPKTPKSLRKGW